MNNVPDQVNSGSVEINRIHALIPLPHKNPNSAPSKIDIHPFLRKPAPHRLIKIGRGVFTQEWAV